MEKGKDAFFEDSQVLKNISMQLKILAKDVSSISETVSCITKSNISQKESVIKKLQKIDSVYQSLNDLSVLADALSEKPFVQKTSVEQLKLASTRSLLLKDTTPTDIESGSVDFF